MFVDMGAVRMSRTSRHLRSISYSRANAKPPKVAMHTSAICQAAWAPPEQPGRTVSKAEGASHGQARGCSMFTADMIESGQNEHGKCLRVESLDVPLDYYFTNNMYDETKLYVAAPGGHRAKQRRTLAQACEITYKKPSCQVQDMDIIRPPALMLRCTAAACAGVVGSPNDPFGILPDGEAVPEASFYGFLTATNSRSVNKLSLIHI